jgi:hypothetical protein
MKMKEYVIAFPENNRIFGISKKFLKKKDLEFLKDLAEYLMKSNERPIVEIVETSKDSHGIVNRINIYIKTPEHRLTIRNVYCGGAYGTDRILGVLYNLENVLEELVGENSDQYAGLSISSNYKIL